MRYEEPTVKFTDEVEMRSGRLWILAVLMAVVTVIYTGVLIDTQVFHHEEYLAQATHSIVRVETVKASRGVLTDRNGKTLISNAFTHDLTFDATLLKKDQDPNEAILRLIQLCIRENRRWTDSLPVTWEEPFAFTIDSATAEQRRLFLNYLSNLSESRNLLSKYLENHRELVDVRDLEEAAAQAAQQAADATGAEGIKEKIKELMGKGTSGEPTLVSGRKLLERLDPGLVTSALLADAGIDAGSFLKWMGREFSIPDSFTPSQLRSVAGVQYEMKLRTLGDNSVFILTEDIDTAFLSLLADGDYDGYKIINSSIRQYDTDAAAHILGTVGPLYKEDRENPLYEGYPLDATIGKSGMESAFEQYLHGVDGRRVLSYSDDGKITGEYYSQKPQPGSTVELTLDLDFQEAVERALAETIEDLNRTMYDATRGAGVAVVRVGTGEILALASYPTYTLNDYRTRYSELAENPASPLLNRATQSGYPPGSTLKPATAFAALDSGKTTLTERIYDTGRWYYPRSSLYTNCWYQSGHGSEYLSKAITDSCNYYFAEMGYRMGMDTLNSYLKQFGLGEHTGIETGDYAGQRAFNPPGQDQAPWAAYGQSTQLYTPLQLANYIATLVSGGKHCQAHLLKAVKSYDGARVLAQGDTSPTNTMDIQDKYLDAIKTGMHNLVHGQLWRLFSECAVDAGAKTGTAQLGGGKINNAVFVCFAPYDEPEIALGMVIERGDSGSKLTSAAVKILNAYFGGQDVGIVTGDNALLP